MSEEIHEGGCYCGAVRYRVTGRPSNTMVCHCRSCRRISAAPVTPWLTFRNDQFEFIRGQPSAFHSSAAVKRRFCPGCGTPLTYEHKDNAGTIDITACSLDLPDAFPPTHHSWLSDDVAWVRFGDGLPGFPEWRKDKT
ncbi:MAG: GFA family protein [Panacagrimonas sp.]